MRSSSVFIVLLFCTILALSQTIDEQKKAINLLVSKMTLEEKVGQMTQLTLDYVCKGAAFDDHKEMFIDPARLDSAVRIHHVGSILNTGTYTLSRNKWYELITQIQNKAQTTRLKIPIIYGVDGIHGATYTQGSTLMPQQLALAATWEPNLAEQAGTITAYELRASAIPWNFSPVLDLGRQPLWSRFFETFGEDPLLASAMGNAMLKGYQGNDLSSPDRVVACLKHFVGYSLPFSGKDRTPVLMPERLLREYYLVPFAQAIQQGALTVMVHSGEINGTPGHANYHLLTEILKDELKFEGFAVTDWEDIKYLHTVHKVAPSYKDAVAIAINAGIDMSMVPSDIQFCKYLIELVKEGRVAISRIDDAVSRILWVKYKLGLFTKSIHDFNDYKKFGSEEFAKLNYNAAVESITLLKNESQILPLNKTNQKVLVTGVASNSLTPLNGAWTHTWQGRESKYNPKNKKTIFQAINDKIGNKAVWIEGTSYDQDINTEKTVEEAKKSDIVVICLGEYPGTEKPADIEDLNFDKIQLELVKRIAATGKPIVLVLAEARPRLITEIEPLAKAIIMAYLLGNEGGTALADILFGEANPSGKLPFTYPKYTGALTTYDHKFSETRDTKFGFDAIKHQFPFGHGLSYTQFTTANLTIDKTSFNLLDSVTVSVDVKNIGAKSGKEVVQLYIRDEFASITPSIKRLRAFKKIFLHPNETQKVTFKVAIKDLGFVNYYNQWIVEPGDFTAMIGNEQKGFVVVQSPK